MSVNNLNTVNSVKSPSATNPGFWEIGAYKANVYRIRDGFDQFDELTKLIKERVELENKYGRSLQTWSQKWKSYSDKSLPSDSIKTSLDGVLTEGKELARVHLAVKDRLNDEVVKTIGAFKEGSYHRSAIRGLKQQKEIEDKFEKAQHRWKKLYGRVDAAKKHYHSCCRAEKSSYIQMINSQADLSMSQEGSEKSRDRHEKCREETKKARLAYEQQLKDISYENTAYIDKMACVFEECQQFEYTRMKFFVEMVSGMQKVLVDLVSPPKLLQIHASLENMFKSLGDSQLKNDLKKWAELHGTGIPPKWPAFEQYAPEIHTISTKSPSNNDTQAGGVILTKKVLKSEIGYDGGNGRHHSVGNVSTSSSSIRPFPSASMSTQDVYRAGLGLGDEQGVGTSKFYSNNHRRISSFDSVQDNTATNSEAASAPTSLNGEVPAPPHSIASNLNSFASAKSSMTVVQAGNPFADPFPLRTPQQEFPISNTKFMPKTTALEKNNQCSLPPPYKHIYNANKNGGAMKETDFQQVDSQLRSSSRTSTLDSTLTGISVIQAMEEDGTSASKNLQARAATISAQNEFSDQERALKSTLYENAITTKEKMVVSTSSSVESTEATKENILPPQELLDTMVGSNPPDNNNTIYGNGIGDDNCVKVRVLYDYKPTESDELPLVKGELVEMFRPADDMGWCYGRKNSKIGFFPAGYVSKV